VIVIDGSALVAILMNEPEGPLFFDRIAAAPQRIISAANYVETCLVADRAPGQGERFDRMFTGLSIEIVSVTPELAHAARAANRRFGKGSGHRARLNFGDCFAYALAREKDWPLLFKGDDFAATDIRSAL
jgi:ribonuclease VapC